MIFNIFSRGDKIKGLGHKNDLRFDFLKRKFFYRDLHSIYRAPRQIINEKRVHTVVNEEPSKRLSSLSETEWRRQIGLGSQGKMLKQ